MSVQAEKYEGLIPDVLEENVSYILFDGNGKIVHHTFDPNLFSFSKLRIKATDSNLDYLDYLVSDYRRKKVIEVFQSGRPLEEMGTVKDFTGQDAFFSIRLEKKAGFVLARYKFFEQLVDARPQTQSLSHLHFNSFVEQSTDPYLIITAESLVVYANQKAQDFFGIEPFQKEVFFSEFMKEGGEFSGLMRAIERIKSGAIGPIRVDVFCSKTEPSSWFSVSIEEFFISSDTKNLLLHFREITERKEMEIKLLHAKAKYDLALNSFLDLYYVVEANDNGDLFVSTVSPSVLEISGYTVEETIGRSSLDFYVNPADQDVFLKEIFQKGFVSDYEMLLKHKDGHGVWMTCTAKVFQENGKMKVSGVLKDISKRKEQDSFVREQEEFYHCLVENSLEITLIVDEKASVRFVSPAITPTMGYEPGELIDQNIFQYIHADDRLNATTFFANRVQVGGKGRRLTWRFYNKQGEIRYLAVMINNMLDHPIVKGVIVNAVDITPRVIAENNLISSTERITLLHEINHIILESESVLETADKCLSIMVDDIAKCERGSIVRFHDNEVVEVISSYSSVGENVFQPGMKIDYQMALNYLNTNQGEAFCEMDLNHPSKPHSMHQVFLDSGVKSIACFPYFTKGKLAGAINLSSLQENFFTPEIMIHLESACNQISLGLQKEILKEKLVESEFQKTAIIAGIPDLIFRIDRNGVFLDSHFHSTDQLYVPPGMFIGKSMTEIFDKVLSDRMIASVQRSLDRNEIVMMTYSLDTPGMTQHFEARMTPIHENEVIAVVRNITERVVSEQELKTKNQALETSPDAVFIVDSNTHHFIYINDAFIKITGFSENDIRDMFFDLEEARRNKLNWSNYLFRVKKKQEEIAAALKKERFYKGDFISITKEGEPYWSFFSMQHMELSNNRSYFVGVIRDITEIRELERKLLNAVVETQETERRRIAADLHDGVGQTLTAVNMYFNALKEEFSEHQESSELFSITSDLITKAIADTRMISHTLMPSSLNNFGLKQAIEEMVDRYNTLEMGIKINFAFDISDKKINSRVEIAIYRIIQEIISNAMKHSKAKNIFLTIYEEGENLVVTALDDGIGFNMEKVRRGLGLTSLETRVQSINGKLQIHTSEGNGTQIRINLPSQDLFQTTTNTEL